MKKTAIFLHTYQFGNWKEVYNEQIVRLQRSGLYDFADFIFVGVNGTKENQPLEPMPYDLVKINRVFKNSKFEIDSEYVTMKAIYDYACVEENAQILYIQSKGVSWWHEPQHAEEPVSTPKGYVSRKLVFQNTQYWRKYLEFFLIDNWKRCLELLEDHDTVGTEWLFDSYIGNYNYPIPHYAGNMWWANSSYIRKLDPNFITNNMLLGRYSKELWIGTKNPKYYNFFDSGRNLYADPIFEEEYTSTIATQEN